MKKIEIMDIPMLPMDWLEKFIKNWPKPLRFVFTCLFLFVIMMPWFALTIAPVLIISMYREM